MSAARAAQRVTGQGTHGSSRSRPQTTKASYRELVGGEKQVHAVQVADPSLFEDLLDGIEPDLAPVRVGGESRLDHSTLVQTQMEALAAHKRETQRLSTQAYEEKLKKMRDAQAKHHAKLERDAEADFERRMQEFEQEREYAERVQKTVDAYQASRSRKAEQLHREWEDEVYYNIQEQIQEQMNSGQWKQSWDAKREAFDNYLKESSKRQVFRETASADGYDPFAAQNKRVKYKLKHIKDPVKRDVNKKYDEDALVGASMNGRPPRVPVGRTGLDVTQWSHLESTPYVERDDSRPAKPTAPMAKTSVVLDHYQPIDPNAARGEFPRGKRINVGEMTKTTEEPHASRGKRMVPENRFSQGKETTHINPEQRGKRVFEHKPTALY